MLAQCQGEWLMAGLCKHMAKLLFLRASYGLENAVDVGPYSTTRKRNATCHGYQLYDMDGTIAMTNS
jgi:hypothetical protein